MAGEEGSEPDPGETLTLAEAAEALGLAPTRMRQLLREHRLLALPGPGGPRIPAAFVPSGEILRGLTGLITVLHDAGYTDAEALRWLFTADPTLPGSPVEALQAGRITEVHRRAQALAF